MNIKYLEYFQTLAKYQHYTRAAEELGIAQSSLSHAIGCLEAELGAVLFEKDGRNIVLSGQGTQYLRYVNAALQFLDDGKRQLQKSASGVIEVGVVSSMRRFVIEKINMFEERRPYGNCQFSIYEGATGPLLESLRRDRIDLLLASAPEEGQDLVSTALIRQSLIVIDSEKQPHIDKDTVTVEELAEHPQIFHTPDSGIRRIADHLFDSHGKRPIIAGEASEDTFVAAMVQMGMGVAVVTDSENVRMTGLHRVTLDDPENYRYIYLTMKKNRYVPPALASFVEYLKENLTGLH